MPLHVGIVGSEGAKFTPETEAKARESIREMIANADVVISGGCHLGGIDIWAIEEAKKLNKKTVEYLPKRRRWNGGYKERNIKIALNSDILVCITVEKLPENFTGMRFEKCYHCPRNTFNHVKSGGCWTMKEAKRRGKSTVLVVIKEN
jgi:hypothetical protein